MIMTSKLVAVTPAKNEEKFIAKCVSSVSNQTFPVTLHLVVDDWSDDRTRQIVESYGDKIMVIPSNLEKGEKVHGIRPHLVTEIGMRKVTRLVPNWKYCLLIDADVWIPPNYCGTLIKEMEKNPKLVMAGAKYLKTPSKLEVAPGTHVRSSNHIIRRDFYDRSKIGYKSLQGEIMLERISLILGYQTRTFPLTAFEGRPTGITVKDQVLRGVYDYRLGYPILPSLFRLRKLEKEYYLALFGWIYAKLHHEVRYFTKKEIKILYRIYLDRLFKRRFTGQ